MGKPDDYNADPTANAIMNVAAAIDRLAQAVNSLLYGLKYSKGEGMSIAEAIEHLSGLIGIYSPPRDSTSRTMTGELSVSNLRKARASRAERRR
jgi:hypothetical protein